VDGLDLTIRSGESVGLVGESGSGKTTVGRLLLKLTEPSAGKLDFDGSATAGLAGASLRRFRQRAQLVFQNPFDALNPRFTIRQAVAEPLVNMGVPAAERDDRVAEALQLVQLRDVARYADRRPRELSGGQLQRVVLARALVLRPDFLVADEPVSMLDLSVRAGVLNLMRDLRDQLGLTALYISHDLTLVRYVCDRTLVMYLGKVVEDGPTEEVIRRPAHPYTQALIKAVPRPRAGVEHEEVPLGTSQPNAVSPPSGCRLRDRCPHSIARCAEEVPLLRHIGADHAVACHLAG
jgi:oligopeptide/dipeptide ABC transporter ATP-binding protein